MFKNVNRKVKHFLAKLVLSLIGPLKQKEKFEGSLDSIIILAQEKIGDAILLTPLLKNLRRALPNIRIHVITYSPIFSFFEQDRNVDMVYKGKNHYFSFYKAMRTKKFDLLFNTKDHPSFTFLYQSRIIPARHRVGIEHPHHRGFFNHMIQLDFHQHVIEKNCALLDYVGIPYTKEECRPYLPEGIVSDAVRSFISNISDQKSIGINLSASEKNREWSLTKWMKLLEKMRRPVVVLSMPNRYQDKRRLEELYEHVIPSPTTRSIHEAGQIVRHLNLLVTPDTSLIHAASCYETSVVGLYRADEDHYRRFYPYLTPNRMVISSTNRVEDIPVESIIDAVEELNDQ